VPVVEVPLPGLRLELFEAEPDAAELGDVDADTLPDTDADALGLAARVGVDVDEGVAGAHGVPVAVAAFLVPAALTLAGAETVVVVALAEAVPVVVAVDGAVALSLGLTLLAGVPLSPLVALPVGGLAGVTVGVTDLLGVAVTDGEELDGHTGTVGLLWPMALALWLRPPFVVLCWLADPAGLETRGPGLCEEVIPTAELRL